MGAAMEAKESEELGGAKWAESCDKKPKRVQGGLAVHLSLIIGGRY